MYGGMYGSGLGMGGMGGMYGGMGGMGSSMYGGGLGMGGGMYGGGLGMGGMGSSMYGSGGMYGSSGLNGGSSYGMSGGMNGFGRSNQLSSANNMNNGVGGDGLQGNGMQSPLNLQGPDQANQLASPINQNTTPLPPLNESPEERSRRIQAEHKKERQLIRQQREQHRQARLQARMEIAGHFTNILVQGLRSAMELFGVCFGTYYSMKAVRAFSSMQPGMGMMGGQRFPTAAIQQQQAAAATAAARSQQVAATGAATTGPSRWRTWLLCIALFILGEVAYSVATRQRTKPPQRRRRISGPTEDAYGNVISQDEYEVSIRSTDDESEMTEKEREEESMSDAWSQAYGTSNGNNIYGGLHGSSAGGNRGVRRVFYALYDYEAPQADGSCLSFRAGDEFVVEDYVEGSWCEATAVDGGNYSSRGRRGLVPSNFLRLVERATKL